MVRKAVVTFWVVWVLAFAACAGMTVQQKVDTGMQVAQQVFAFASGYYAINAPSMTEANQVLFKKYLDGFALALETGAGINGFIQRWYQFQQGF